MPMTSMGAGMPMTTMSNAMSMPMVQDWAIPQPTQAKYTQIFQATDKARSGFMAGVQAKNILMQSGLQQNILAQIW